MKDFTQYFSMPYPGPLTPEETRLWRLLQVRAIGRLIAESPSPIEGQLTAWLLNNLAIAHRLYAEWFPRSTRWDDAKIGAHIRAIIAAGKDAYKNVPIA